MRDHLRAGARDGAVAGLVVLLVVALWAIFLRTPPVEQTSAPVRVASAPDRSAERADGAVAAPEPEAAPVRAPAAVPIPEPELATPEAAPEADTVEPPAASTISGVVVDGAAAPVPGVGIWWSASSSGKGDGKKGGSWQHTATGEDGRFVLEGVTEGADHQLYFEPNAGAKGKGKGKDDDWDESLPEDRPAFLPTVREDVPAGADLRVVLSSGAGLAGVVLERATGAPVAGAIVSATPIDGTGTGGGKGGKGGKSGLSAKASSPRAGRAVSDDEGRFLITGLQPADYRLEAQSDGFAPAKPDNAIPVAADQRRDGIVIELATGVVLAGRVVDAAERPVFGASISVDQSADDGDAGRGKGKGKRGSAKGATTDESGAFRIEHLTPGPAIVHVTHEAFEPAREELILPDVGGLENVTIALAAGGSIEGIVAGLGDDESATVTVTGGPVGWNGPGAEVDVGGHFAVTGLAPGQYRVTAAAKPRVRSASVVVRAAETVRVDFDLDDGVRVEGTVRASGGGPVADANLELVAPGDPWARVAGRTDAAGAFAIDGVRPGTYATRVGKMAGPEVEIGQGPVERVAIELAQGELTLRVVDATTKEGVPGLSVLIVRPETDLSTATMGEVKTVSVGFSGTDEDGSAVLAAPAEEVTVHISGAGYVAVRAGPVVVAPDAITDLGTIEVTRGADARLLVVDPEGQPVSGARASLVGVDAMPDWSAFGRATRADGILELSGLAAGRHRFSVVAPGFARVPALVDVPAPSAEPIRVTLVRGGAIEVNATGPDGAPISGARVVIEPFQGQASPTEEGRLLAITPTRTDARGLFRRDDVAPGAYRVRVSRGDGQPEQVAEVTVAAAETAPVALTLP